MANIKITMKNGKVFDFIDKGRSGGSWSTKIRYEGAFAIVTDEWEAQTAIPAEDIAKIEVEAPRSAW